MIKKIISSALILATFALFAMFGMAVVQAQSTPTSFMPQPNAQLGTGLDSYSFSQRSVVDVVGDIGKYVIGVLVIVAVFYVLWAAYTFITAAGETEKISQARNRIMYAGIGIVVALLAQGIIALVLSAAGAGSATP